MEKALNVVERYFENSHPMAVSCRKWIKKIENALNA